MNRKLIQERVVAMVMKNVLQHAIAANQRWLGGRRACAMRGAWPITPLDHTPSITS